MFSVIAPDRKRIAAIVLSFAALILAACDVPVSNGPRINANAPVPVALLVPGGSAESSDLLLAESLENAARLAMADLQGAEIDLRVYNTAGQADFATVAAQQAVNDGAKVILGPVFAEAANAAGIVAASRGVNVLAFSNNPSIAGGNVFILGQTFDTSARRLVRYALSQGKSSIHIAHGNDASETAARNAIGDAIALEGAVLAGVTSFDLTQQGVVDAIPRIIDDIRLSGADVIFLTSGTSGALPFLAQLLPEAGLDPTDIQYVGLQRWDIPASAMTLPGLQGGWFVRPDPGLSTLFAERYTAAYGGAPHPIAGLAYDGIAAIGALASQGQADALTTGALTQAAGFAGVNGVFRLLPDGTNERGLAVSQIFENQVIVIDPAPRSFGQPGL